MERQEGPYAGKPIRLVSFDVDGTIAIGHGWRAIASFRGEEEAFDRAQDLFVGGEATEDEHLRRLLNFARGLPLSDLEGILDRTHHLPHLVPTIAALHARGTKVALLTHNPLYVCRWYARHYGFDLFAGVQQSVRDGTIQGVRNVHVDKREGLRLLLQATGSSPSEVVHLGDGLADARVFPYVASGIALNSRIPEVRARADLTVDTRDARKLLPLLRYGVRAHPRPLPSGDPPPRVGSFRCERLGS
ncbi:MAG: HAD family hydrolase [Euryarchaeota archaeon]|nr:HAD family hydrolase [Euryarchaeota archaeon]MDE1837788.1 HAD family hydrolase [Euryarchaeota archaeon]MDE1881295.1 HAD family hydrolase [Euryarchaeota archaeon]MDE2046172.1 HAD family hydrolase [Thermoplasmata archaeon]